MAQDKVGDRAEVDGVIYTYDGAGWVPANSVPTGIGVDPYKAAENTRQNSAEARAITNDARQARKLAMDLRKAELDLREAERKALEPATGSKEENAMAQRIANLRSLQQQIDRVRELHAKGPGATSGLASLGDYLPTGANRQFDAAGAGLGDIGTAAFKVPGMGTQSDQDAARFVRANEPSASDYDATVEEKLRTLENRLNNTLIELGQKPRQQAKRNEAAVPGNTPTDNLIPATGGTKTEIIRSQVDKKLAAMLESGVSAGTIKAYAKANNVEFPNMDAVLAWRALHPGAKGYEVYGKRIVPTTMLNRTMASPVMTGITQAANAATAGTLDEMGGAVNALVTGDDLSDSIAAANFAKQSQAALNPKSALAGNIIGGAGAMLGGGAALGKLGINLTGKLAPKVAGKVTQEVAERIAASRAALLGDMAYGTAYGAGEQNDNRLMGGAVGAGSGLVGNRLGAGVSNLAGRAIRGVVNPAVQGLRARGIDLTGGEMFGGWVKGIEDRLEGFAGVGDLLAGRNAASRRQLNQAAFDEGGGVINTPINGVGATGLGTLERAKSSAYDTTLNPVRIDANDPRFLGDMTSLVAASNRIPAVNGAQEAAASAIESRIGGAVDPATDTISGRGFQEAYRGLARTARERANSDYGHEVGDVMRQGQDALLDALPPDALAGFMRANSANRHLSVLTDAVNAAKSQLDQGDALFTPAQLGTAATNNAKKYGGKLSAAIGERPFDQLIRDSQEVMSSKVADSGTAGRVALGLALTGGFAGAGGGLGAAAGDSGTGAGLGVGALATMAALNTRAGQAALTKILLSRAAPFRRAGDALVNYGPRVGQAAGLGGVYLGQSSLTPP